MTGKREIIEGLQVQGTGEKISYSFATTPWGSSPSAISVQVFSISATGIRTDVTATVMPTGTASVVGDTITLPRLVGLSPGVLYRVDVKFTCSGNEFKAYAFVKGEY